MIRDEAISKVRTVLWDNCEVQFGPLDRSLDSLGLDSLEFLDVMIRLGIPDEDVSHLHTIEDLVKHLSS